MTSSPSIILCVDDEAANLKLLENILVPRGYSVVGAANGKGALDTLRSQAIDLVLLDVIMPGMDGFEVCRQIKGDPGLASIPVIMITAMTAKRDRVRAIEAGAEEFLSKPFDQTEALARIGMLLKVKELGDDRRRAAAALQEANDRLRELEGLRDSLVHMVIHDLRNPLTVITMFASLLESTEGENLSAKGRGYVQHIINSADFLTEMCSSMLDVSKMESGQMQLHLTTCDICAIVREIVPRMEDPENARRIALVLPEEPALVRGDAQLLSRLVQNLVGNAIKFAPDSGGRVDIAVSQGGDRVRCAVKDNGRGIPPEDQKKVFDKFWQASAQQQGRKHSSGLGLTFCRMVVEAHGGEIGVESEGGLGSTFWFELPRAAGGGEPDASAPTTQDAPGPSRLLP
jgi:signal transduction histidine kinase